MAMALHSLCPGHAGYPVALGCRRWFPCHQGQCCYAPRVAPTCPTWQLSLELILRKSKCLH
eukprot:1282525-Amphidinium_carterae.2